VHLVREGEEFDHWIDENGEHIKHKPQNDETKKIVKVYAMATTKAGGTFIAVMTMAEVEKHEKSSRAKRSDAPWKTWREEMIKKTAIKRLAKLLPKSAELEAYLEAEEAEELGIERPPAGPRPELYGSALDYFAAEEIKQDERVQE
jgi:recombination protein RecT